MALKVVGTGLGRTGTKSMQTALNMLGFGPCHHMVEVFRDPPSMALWVRGAKGEPVWNEIFKDYQSAVDYPAAAHWRALTSYYPDAKVLHTVRDPDQWFDSTQATIFSPRSPATSGEMTGLPAEFFTSFMGPFREKLHDRAYMTDYFRRHTEEVLATIAPERLLVYEVGEGWDRLCAFLGVPVPAEPYPSENSRQEFIGRIASASGEMPTPESLKAAGV